ADNHQVDEVGKSLPAFLHQTLLAHGDEAARYQEGDAGKDSRRRYSRVECGVREKIAVSEVAQKSAGEQQKGAQRLIPVDGTWAEETGPQKLAPDLRYQSLSATSALLGDVERGAAGDR